MRAWGRVHLVSYPQTILKVDLKPSAISVKLQSNLFKGHPGEDQWVVFNAMWSFFLQSVKGRIMCGISSQVVFNDGWIVFINRNKLEFILLINNQCFQIKFVFFCPLKRNAIKIQMLIPHKYQAQPRN